MHQLICQDCGITFEWGHKGRKYCDKCKAEHLRAHHLRKAYKQGKPCSVCGKQVARGRGVLPQPICRPCRKTLPKKPKRARAWCKTCGIRRPDTRWGLYCSDACRPKAKPQGKQRKCKTCRKQFTTSTKNRVYCAPCQSSLHLPPGPRKWHWRSMVYIGTCQVCAAATCGRNPKHYCSQQCRSRAAYLANTDRFIAAAHKRRALQKRQWVEDVDLATLGKRDKWQCHLCGKRVRQKPRHKRDPDMASIDHLIPISLGGQHSYANTAISHLRCNLSKRTRAMNEQLALL